MEEKKQIVKEYVSKGMLVKQALAISGITPCQYYYQSNGKKRGKRPTQHTTKTNGTVVMNEQVVADIKDILSPDFIDYGYKKVTIELQRKGYHINHKKGAQLMRKHHLLCPVNKTIKTKKTYVKYTKPCPGYPLQALEIDIKYIYLHGLNANAYLITILDVLTRKALVWTLQLSMKSHIVKNLIDKLIAEYLQPYDMLNKNMSVTIRNDNGPQFVSHFIKNYLVDNHIQQECIIPYTPQQNAHIESFHSTVEKLVNSRFVFNDLKHANDVFEKFFDTYNNKRILKVLRNYTPEFFFQLCLNDKVQVVYDIKSKNQLFIFTQEHDLCLVPVSEDSWGIINTNLI